MYDESHQTPLITCNYSTPSGKAKFYGIKGEFQGGKGRWGKTSGKTSLPAQYVSIGNVFPEGTPTGELCTCKSIEAHTRIHLYVYGAICLSLAILSVVTQINTLYLMYLSLAILNLLFCCFNKLY